MPVLLKKALFILGALAVVLGGSSLLRAQLEIDFDVLGRQFGERFGQDRRSVILGWQDLLHGIGGDSEHEQLLRVNEFFHRNVRYKTDLALYGAEDYWATPLELLGHGLGDCEDWAIAKYISLRHLGIPDERLRLIYVRAQVGGPRSPVSQAHMVLGYFEHPSAEPLILDSLISSVLPASERSDLSPVFSFNADGLWVGQGAARAAGSPTARLSHWRDVLDRMHQEGIRQQ